MVSFITTLFQCVAVCCSVLQYVAVCWEGGGVTVDVFGILYLLLCCSVLQCVAVLNCVGSIVLQCVAACCRVLQSVAECCSVLQSVVEYCSMLRSVAGCSRVL